MEADESVTGPSRLERQSSEDQAPAMHFHLTDEQAHQLADRVAHSMRGQIMQATRDFLGQRQETRDENRNEEQRHERRQDEREEKALRLSLMQEASRVYMHLPDNMKQKDAGAAIVEIARALQEAMFSPMITAMRVPDLPVWLMGQTGDVNAMAPFVMGPISDDDAQGMSALEVRVRRLIYDYCPDKKPTGVPCFACVAAADIWTEAIKQGRVDEGLVDKVEAMMNPGGKQ